MGADGDSPGAGWRLPPQAPPRERGGAARRGLWDTRAVLPGQCGGAAAQSGPRPLAGHRAAAGTWHRASSGRRGRPETTDRCFPPRTRAPVLSCQDLPGVTFSRLCPGGRRFRQCRWAGGRPLAARRLAPRPPPPRPVRPPRAAEGRGCGGPRGRGRGEDPREDRAPSSAEELPAPRQTVLPVQLLHP